MYVSACLYMFDACPSLSTRGDSIGSPPRLYERDITDLLVTCFFSVSLAQVLFAALLSDLPHPGDCVHGRPGEQTFKAPSVEILHRETAIRFLGSISARLLASVRLLHRRPYVYILDDRLPRQHHGRRCCGCRCDDLPGQSVCPNPLLVCTSFC